MSWGKLTSLARSRCVLPVLAAGLVLSAVARAQEAAPLTWEALEARGAVIGDVVIDSGNVFDPKQPGEDHWLARLANALHMTTRPEVLRRELGFAPGDPVSARRIHEAERRLRGFRFIKDARIRAELMDDGRVRAVVEAKDAWTLKASIGFSRVGGQNSFGFSLQEVNLLGRGKTIGLQYSQDPDRTSTLLRYQDPQLFGTAWTLRAVYQNLSDGQARELALAKPFRGLDDAWAADGLVRDLSYQPFVEQQGQMAYRVPLAEKTWEAGFAGAVWRSGAEVQRLRIGAEYHQIRYGALETVTPGLLPPPLLDDRRLAGPSIAWTYFQDGFIATRDRLGMNQTEDYNLGWDLQLGLGIYAEAFGSDRNSPFIRGRLAKGWAMDDSLVLLRVGGSARHEGEGIREGVAGANLTWYGPVGKRFASAARVDLDAVSGAGPEGVLYLGGEEGFRGYPNHFWAGDRRWLASFEERLFTDVQLWGLFRLGWVAFTDVGAIRRLDTGAWSRTYVDVGGGLRIGDLKSSLGRVVLLNLAWPLVREPSQDRWQLIFGNLVRF